MTIRSPTDALPVLGLLALPDEGEQLRPLVRALASYARPMAVARLADAPAAVLATSEQALAQLPPDWAPPTAVCRERGAERVIEARVPGADPLVLPLPRPGDPVPDVMARPPLLRRRWRERLGLPGHLVLDLVGDAPAGDLVESLVLASAAVVPASLLPLALALGTPVVTDAASAARLGLTDRVEALVVDDGADAMRRRAHQLADDDVTASALSRHAAAWARDHSTARAAERLAAHLELSAAAPGQKARVLNRLREVGLHEASPVRRRVDRAFVVFEAIEVG